MYIYTVHVARRRLAAVAALLAAHSVARDELAAARCYDGATLDRQCPSTLRFLRCWQLRGAGHGFVLLADRRPRTACRLSTPRT